MTKITNELTQPIHSLSSVTGVTEKNLEAICQRIFIEEYTNSTPRP
jgi:hypothetical protein